MQPLQMALTIVHSVIALALIVIVLMQHGKQQGLSGAIAGGAETFFGKNKGRTIDAMLKRFTAVVAVLFIITSVSLTFMAQNASQATENVEVNPGEEKMQIDPNNLPEGITLEDLQGMEGLEGLDMEIPEGDAGNGEGAVIEEPTENAEPNEPNENAPAPAE